MSKFETKTEFVRGKAIVSVIGYLSGQGGEKLEREIERLLKKDEKVIVIDFEQTNMVNSVGISILVSIIEKIREAEGELYFSDLSQINDEVFRLMGLHRHVAFVKSRKEDEEKSQGGANGEGTEKSR